MLIMLLLEVRCLTIAQYSLRLTDYVTKEMVFIINSSVTDKIIVVYVSRVSICSA